MPGHAMNAYHCGGFVVQSAKPGAGVPGSAHNTRLTRAGSPTMPAPAHGAHTGRQRAQRRNASKLGSRRRRLEQVKLSGSRPCASARRRRRLRRPRATPAYGCEIVRIERMAIRRNGPHIVHFKSSISVRARAPAPRTPPTVATQHPRPDCGPASRASRVHHSNTLHGSGSGAGIVRASTMHQNAGPGASTHRRPRPPPRRRRKPKRRRSRRAAPAMRPGSSRNARSARSIVAFRVVRSPAA